MSDHTLYFSTWHSCIQICDGTSPTWNDSGFAKVASSLLQANAMVDYRNELVMNASALVQSSQQGHLDAWMYQNRKFVHWWTWVQLPYLCVLKEQVVIFDSPHQLAFFFSASGDGRNPSGSKCFSGPLPKWRSNCSHFGFTGLMGWLIWWALRWVGWESRGEVTCGQV